MDFSALPKERSFRHFAETFLPFLAMFAFVLAYAWRFDFLQHIRPVGDLWWADSHQELLRAYYIAHGLRLYDPVPVNHMPGLTLVLSLVMKLVGFAGRAPGEEIVDAAEHAGMATAGLLQVTFWYFAGRSTNLSPAFAAAVAVAALAMFWEGYGHFIPLAETVMIPALALAVVLLHATLLGPARPASALKLGMLMVFGCAVTLGVAPVAVLFGAIAAVTVLLEAARDRPRLAEALRQPAVFVALGALALFFVYLLATCDLAGLYYWNITFNREALSISPGPAILKHLTSFFADLVNLAPLRTPTGTNFPFFAYPPFLLGILLLAAAKLNVRQRPGGAGDLPRVGVFLLACFAAYIALGWRAQGVFVALKFLYGAGIAAGLLFIVCVPSRLLSGEASAAGGNSGRETAALVVGLAVMIVPLRLVLKIPAAGARPEALYQAGVCALDQTNADLQSGACLCAVEAFYDPRRLLQYDVKPCPGLSPDTPHAIQKSPRERERFRDLALSPDKGAFIVGLTERESTMYDIPLETFQAIVDRRVCRPLGPLFRICGR